LQAVYQGFAQEKKYQQARARLISLQADEDSHEAAAKRKVALDHASAEQRGDRELVLAAVKRNGIALQYAIEELRGDRELVLAAVEKCGLML